MANQTESVKQLELTVEFIRKDVSNVTGKEKGNGSKRCGLCWSADQPKEGTSNWRKLSDKLKVPQEQVTIKSIVLKYLPAWLTDIMAPLDAQQEVCAECVFNLQLIYEFINHISVGQEQLKLKRLDKNETIPVKRKRGRPRKTGNSVKNVQEFSDIEDREKRETRLPQRFDGAVISDQKQTEKEVPSSEFAEKCTDKKCEVIPAGNHETKEEGNPPGSPDSPPDVKDSTFNPKNVNRIARRKKGRPKNQKKKVYKCEHCPKSYSSQTSLIYHRVTHQDSKDFNCDICKNSFAHKGLLISHMFTHSSVRGYQCDDGNCKASFKSRGSLFNHKKIVHKKDKTWICEECGSNFSSAGALNSHSKIHLGEKPHICQYCDKRFRRKRNLKEHERIHTREKPFACNELNCTKLFTTSSQLRAHKDRHAGDKLHLCGDCGKCFSHAASLASHMKQHTGEEPVCSTCHKTFADTSSLRKHLMIHSGRKPYRCDVCGKTFSDPSNFRRHKNIHPKPVVKEAAVVVSPITSGNERVATLDLYSGGVESAVVLDSIGNVEETLEPSTDVTPTTDSIVHILTKEQLEAFGTSVSAADGSIIFLYQSDDIFSVDTRAHRNLDISQDQDESTTVVLQEVNLQIGEEMTLSLDAPEDSTMQQTPSS